VPEVPAGDEMSERDFPAIDEEISNLFYVEMEEC